MNKTVVVKRLPTFAHAMSPSRIPDETTSPVQHRVSPQPGSMRPQSSFHVNGEMEWCVCTGFDENHHQTRLVHNRRLGRLGLDGNNETPTNEFLENLPYLRAQPAADQTVMGQLPVSTTLRDMPTTMQWRRVRTDPQVDQGNDQPSFLGTSGLQLHRPSFGIPKVRPQSSIDDAGEICWIPDRPEDASCLARRIFNRAMGRQGFHVQ